MRKVFTIMALAALALLLPPAPGHPSARFLFFDMGTKSSPLREGFVQITDKSAYSPAIGFGWRSTDNLHEFDRAYTKWVHHAHYGREMPPPIFTNELTEDVIYSDEPNEFVVDVPRGDYRVCTISGKSAEGGGDYYVFDVSVADRAQRVTIPGHHIFEMRHFRAKAIDGQIRIHLRPKTTWLLNSVLIYPERGGQIVERDIIAPIQREISLLPPAEWKKWEEVKRPPPPPSPPPTPAERSRGISLFVRHCLDPVYPDSVPSKEEKRSTISMFGAPGEYESASFVVRPLRNLDRCTVSATQLRGPGKIPETAVEVRSVRYMPARPGYLTLYKYLTVPDILAPLSVMSLPKDVNQQYWITVKIPDNAIPGAYLGKLLFTAKNGKAVVDLSLDVLPVRLRKDPGKIHGIYYRDPLHKLRARNNPEVYAYFSRKAEMERRDMAEHGLDAHDSYVQFLDWNTFAVDVEDMQRRLDLDFKYDLNKRMVVLSFPNDWRKRLLAKSTPGTAAGVAMEEPPEAFFEEVTRMVRAVEKERTSRGWPEFLYYPIDEPKKEEKSVQFTAKTLEAVKRVQGVRTFVTANPASPEFHALWPHVDIWCSQPFAWDSNTIERLSKEKHVEFWCYPNHISGECGRTVTAGARMTWGFGLWRSGYKAVFPWIYQYVAGDPHNYLDSPVMDFMNRSAPTGEPVPVILWESFREGILDGKYIYTLQTLIDEAKASPSAERRKLAEKAERDLKHIWDAIPVRQKYMDEGVWKGAQFDAFRRLIADDIVALTP